MELRLLCVGWWITLLFRWITDSSARWWFCDFVFCDDHSRNALPFCTCILSVFALTEAVLWRTRLFHSRVSAAALSVSACHIDFLRNRQHCMVLRKCYIFFPLRPSNVVIFLYVYHAITLNSCYCQGHCVTGESAQGHYCYIVSGPKHQHFFCCMYIFCGLIQTQCPDLGPQILVSWPHCSVFKKCKVTDFPRVFYRLAQILHLTYDLFMDN